MDHTLAGKAYVDVQQEAHTEFSDAGLVGAYEGLVGVCGSSRGPVDAGHAFAGTAAGLEFGGGGGSWPGPSQPCAGSGVSLIAAHLSMMHARVGHSVWKDRLRRPHSAQIHDVGASSMCFLVVASGVTLET